MMFRDYREFFCADDWSWVVQAPSLVIGWPGRCEFRRGSLVDLQKEICALSHNNVARVVAIASPDGTRLDNAPTVW